MGADNILIPAQYLNRDLFLITHNMRKFERIENLKIEDWLV